MSSKCETCGNETNSEVTVNAGEVEVKVFLCEACKEAKIKTIQQKIIN